MFFACQCGAQVHLGTSYPNEQVTSYKCLECWKKEQKEDTMFNVQEWNQKIYKNADGSFVDGGMFPNRCWSNVPARWAEDVRIFLKQAKDELGDRITFDQIKEKWCHLTVYSTAADEEAKKRLQELEAECVKRLVVKGVHPDGW